MTSRCGTACDSAREAKKRNTNANGECRVLRVLAKLEPRQNARDPAARRVKTTEGCGHVLNRRVPRLLSQRARERRDAVIAQLIREEAAHAPARNRHTFQAHTLAFSPLRVARARLSDRSTPVQLERARSVHERKRATPFPNVVCAFFCVVAASLY
eukprot:88896-Pleurochrysis_carterae.AAC.1